MTAKLNDLLDDSGITYGIVQPGSHDPNGVPIVRAGELQGQLPRQDALRVSPDIAERFKRTQLRGGELLISVVGNPGLAVVAPESLSGWNVARAVAVCRPRGVEAEWLALCFKTAQVQQQIMGFLNTTVQATLNLADLKRLSIPVPPASKRRGILDLLGALDDKIAANRRVIATADTLRATLWLRLCRDSEPRPLSSLARFVNGRAFTKDATGTGRVVVRIAELNSGLSGSTVRNDIEVADDHLARPGDFLMAWSGSLTAARWFRDEAIVNQHIFKVIPTEGRSLWSVACAVDSKMADFKHEAAGKATTMGHIQRRHLDEPVLWPVLNEESEAQGQALWERALVAERENETLAKTRDELLPLLMSGKITVRDAEKRVEGVV